VSAASVVLLNLIRNALEAMENCQVRELAITASVRDDHFLVNVSDSGSGISPEIAARLFQPFVTTKAEGMGIGLSVCRTIVEAHGGVLWMEPNSGGGSTFRFTLPVG
jgi:two-component system, LuxR family, sensor kinase FixL